MKGEKGEEENIAKLPSNFVFMIAIGTVVNNISNYK
jgi:hypothetical protein